MEHIGNRIKELRIKKGLSQQQCASYLNMSTRNYQNYENNSPVYEEMGRSGYSKTLLLILMFLGVSYVGYSMGKTFGRRERFYRELIMLCNMLVSNIRFNKNKLYIIIENYCKSCSADMRLYLENYLNNNIENISFLSPYDNEIIREFFLGLGGFDCSGEIGYIDNYKVGFEECYNNSVEENKKYGVLYTKLGFMVGLIVVILLI